MYNDLIKKEKASVYKRNYLVHEKAHISKV